MSISTPFIKRPIATSLLTAAIFLSGLAAYPLLPVAPLPNVQFPTLTVSAQYPGASPETMASTVATPLETEFGQMLPGLTQMTSASVLGSTQITLQFGLSTDLGNAETLVLEAMNAAQGSLPKDMPTPPTFRAINPADSPIMILAMQSDQAPITEVDNYAENLVEQQISQLPGVGQVLVGGQQTPSIHVQVDPARLASMGLTLEDVRNVLTNATVDDPKGSIDGPHQSFTVYANDQMTTAEPYNNLIIGYRNGAPIHISDIGRAVPGPQNRELAAWTNGKPSILLLVFKQPNANVISTADGVKAQLPSLRADFPPDISLSVVSDRTLTIRASVADVEFTLMLAVGLVVMVIFLFLRNVWATIIPSLTIPVALVATLGMMYVCGFSLDNLSLMGLTIAVGFVVDDASVMLENIFRHIEEGMDPVNAALVGAGEIGFTILSISLSLIAVFIPLLLMGGIVGRLFREFALTVTASIAVSALVSLTLAPMLCSRFMRPESHDHGAVYRFIERGFAAMLSFYQRTLDVVLRHQPITLGVFFANLALTVVMMIYIPKGFFPIQDIGLINGISEGAQDTSPAEMMRLNRELGAVILRDPDVAAFGSTTGSTGGAKTANTGDFTIVLKPREQRELNASQIIDRLRPQLAKITGANLFLQAAQDITVGGRIARSAFQYTLQDPNIAELIEWSQKLLDKMRTLPELVDVSSDLLASAPQLKVTINRDQASRFGISPQMIDDTLNDAYGQRQITQYFTQLNTYFLILEILPDLQSSLESLDRIYVKSPLTGAAVPLSALVDTNSYTTGPLSINHQGQFPAATQTFNLRAGVALGEAVDAINKAVRDIGMPNSVLGTFQGNAQAFQSSRSSEPALIAAALVVVYIILGMLYESFIHPLTILSTLPSAGIGALLALSLGHMDLSVIGIIGIMMVDFAIVAERERNMPPVAAIREACLLRFRPILMTTAAALLAGLPMM